MEELKRMLSRINIAPAQKIFVFAVLADIIPASYIDLYTNNADKNDVFALFGKAGLAVAEGNTFVGRQHVARIAFSKEGEMALRLAEALKEHREESASVLMGEPESLHAVDKVILNRRAYPADLKDNPLVRFRFTKGGMDEQVEYVRRIMRAVKKDFPELAKEFHLADFEARLATVVV